jgi:hypothetical protein
LMRSSICFLIQFQRNTLFPIEHNLDVSQREGNSGYGLKTSSSARLSRPKFETNRYSFQ